MNNNYAGQETLPNARESHGESFIKFPEHFL